MCVGLFVCTLSLQRRRELWPLCVHVCVRARARRPRVPPPRLWSRLQPELISCFLVRSQLALRPHTQALRSLFGTSDELLFPACAALRITASGDFFWESCCCNMDWSNNLVWTFKKCFCKEQPLWGLNYYHGRGRGASGERCPRRQGLGPTAEAQALCFKWNTEHREGLCQDTAFPAVGKFDIVFHAACPRSALFFTGRSVRQTPVGNPRI